MSVSLRLVCALLICIGAAHAAHITDKLVVGVYAEPDESGTPLRLIASGTPLEVLQRREGFSEVRLVDDVRGWVSSEYITDEKPAKAMLLETQARLRQMGIELAALREQAGTLETSSAVAAPDTAPPTAREAQLRQSLLQTEQRVADLERALADVPHAQAAREQLEALRSRSAAALELLAEAHGKSLIERAADAGVRQDWIGRYQLLIVGVAALLLGIGIGIALIDYRIRKRYGGFRI